MIWLGQFVSMLGSAMTWFAFTIWAWEKSGQPSALSTVSFFTFLPGVLLSPVAGVLVDRWNRKLVMMFSDLASAAGTLAAFILLLTGQLEIWHIFVIALVTGFFNAFQYPAYAAAAGTMLTKEDLGRAQGMLGSAHVASSLFAPLLAAALLNNIGLPGIMILDLATFAAAIAALLLVRVPQPAVSAVGQASRGSFFKEFSFGFRYIFERPSLRSLVFLFMTTYITLAIGTTLMAPMALSQTNNDRSALATMQSVGALGGIIGGALLTFWGGPKRRMYGILLAGAAASLFGVTGLGLGATLLWWSVASFLFSFFEPFLEGSNLAYWQSKVEPDVQGRVFSARHIMVQLPYLFGIFIAGPLAEIPLSASLPWFGEGISANIRILMVVAGFVGALFFLLGFLDRSLHHADLLPASHSPAQEPTKESSL